MGHKVVRLPRDRLARSVVLLLGAILVVWVVARLTGLAGSAEDRVWERIRQEGVLRVGMDASYPPFEVVGAEGQFEGFDVDLAHLLAERWGVDVHFVNVHFDGLYDALAVGKFDLIISALPYDRTMTRDLAYSISYFDCGQVLLARTADISVTSVEDLSGRSVLVELGSEGHQLMRRLAKEKGLEVSIVTAREPVEVMARMGEPGVDAVVCDRVQAFGYLQRKPEWQEVGDPLTAEAYVIAADAQAVELIAQVDASLEEWLQDETLQALQAAWLN